jgi:hypothetical protein
MQLFMAVLMTPSEAVSDFGGRRYHRFVNFNFLLSLFTGVVVTGNKFIAGVIDTGGKFISDINDTGDKFIAGVVDTGEQLIAGVVDTGDKHSFANISANFRKNSKRPLWNTLGPGGTMIHEKNLKSKISCHTPFNISNVHCYKSLLH